MAAYTYYEVMGVPRNSSDMQIKQAFRELVRKYHPDTTPGVEGSRFRAIVEAYRVLSVPHRRREYDREISNTTVQSGLIVASRNHRKEQTHWTGGEVARRRKGHPPFAAAPSPHVEPVRKSVNRRAHRRLKLDLPILVRDQHGAEEIGRAEDVSVRGFCAILSLDLPVGGIVTYACPFSSDGQNIEQKAECCWSASASPGGAQQVYGFRRIEPSAAHRGT